MFEPSEIVVNGINKDSSEDLQVSVFSPSFQYGLSVFEGIRGYLNSNSINCFELSNHLNRLIKSANLIGFNIDDGFIEIVNSDIKKLLSKKVISKDIYIKYILCYLKEGSWTTSRKPDRVTFFYPLRSRLRDPNPCHKVKAKFSSISRISSNAISPYIKAGANYINSRLAYFDVNMNEQDNIYPIFINQKGSISESSGACIFMLKGTKLITPPLSDDLLPSITREVIISLVKDDENIEFCEKSISRWELLDSDGVLLLGTNVEMLSVSHIGNYIIKSNQKLIDYIYGLFKKKAIGLL